MRRILFPALFVVSFLLLASAIRPASAAESKQSGNSEKGTTPTKGYKDLNVEQFDKLRSNTNTIILDVRTPEEFSAGHIPGAKNIDINSLDFDKKTGQLDKSKTYLVNCASGGRSARACGKLSKMNFENCYNLLGGMHAWEKAGKPVEK